MFERLGHFVFKHRRAVIIVWLVVIVLSAVLAPKAWSRLAAGAVFTDRGDAAEGSRILEQELGIKANTLVVVFHSDTLRADDPRFMDEMDAALGGLEDLSGLDPPITYRSIGDPNLISRDGHTTYAAIGVNGDQYDACALVPCVRQQVISQPHLTMAVTGDAPFRVDSERATESVMDKVAMYSVPLVVIVLLIVFGSLVAAGLPLAMGAASIVLTMGIVFFISHFVNMSTSSMTVVVGLGLATGVDYSLIMVCRFREELQQGKGTEESVLITVTTAGKAIFYSASTCAIGLAGLVSFQNAGLRSAGIGGMVVVLLALTAGLTLLPSLLSVLGPNVNRLTLFRLAEERGTFWQRLARWEMKHPVIVLCVVVPLLGLFIWPVAHIAPSNVSYAQVPKDVEARRGYDMLAEGFGAGEIAPIMVSITADSGITRWDNVAALHQFTRRIALNEEVSRVQSIVDLDPTITRDQYEIMYSYPDAIPDPESRDAIKMVLTKLTSEHTTLVLVYPRHDPMGPQATALVTYIRNINTGGFQVHVSGPTALTKDMVDQMYRQFIWVLIFITVATYLALYWLLKSAVLPLKAILLNLASVAATYGILVFIFQDGHFSGALNFTADGSTVFMAIVIVYGVVFGLSMDYEVFLLTRVRETWLETRDNTASVALGLAHTGRVITSAALVMVAVFAAFLLGDIVLSKIVGMGIALSVLLDATIIRLLLAPALMRILGKWNWWAPSFTWRHPLIVKEPGHEVGGEAPVYTAVRLPTGDVTPAPSEGGPTSL
jgi:RND superfamily putative drug exporter